MARSANAATASATPTRVFYANTGAGTGSDGPPPLRVQFFTETTSPEAVYVLMLPFDPGAGADIASVGVPIGIGQQRPLSPGSGVATTEIWVYSAGGAGTYSFNFMG